MAELIMLRLEGLLQSWSDQFDWDERGTSNFPSKSAIVGLIACAMGLERDSEEIPALAQTITVGVRADRQGTVLCDLHTVEGMPYLMNAEGKKRQNGNTILSTRRYLQDASFLAVVDAPEHWRGRIRQAFQEPKWCMYLGRKSCVPSRPVWDGLHDEYADVPDAIRRFPPADRADPVMAYEVEIPCPDQVSLTRSDKVRGFREFSRRQVWRGIVRREE